ncbi:MAG: ATP-binding protein [Eubacterium sp.]|nr:ATP-binding protein [Eubacterium sp.]
MERRLPIGIQGFEKLKEEHYLYVDKTEYIYQLVHGSGSYFLSRPRRFGKSLLLSAIRAYWDGKKDLFRGLAIEELERSNPDAWKSYPVFFFDFNGENYQENSLESILDQRLADWEAIYGDQYKERTLGDRFQKLLEMAAEQTGRRCVVLVDEYDKPLLETIEDLKKEEHNREVFKSFFSVLKKADESIQFVFITGVTKFNKISIFSDLNQLRDISLSREFSGICGITGTELTGCFDEEIEKLAKVQELSRKECIVRLKQTYDGYHFHPDSSGVYNPFSLLNAFAEGDFGSYWFSTGTPGFLVKRLKKMGFDVRKLNNRTLYASEAKLSNYTVDNPDPLPLLYQTGYLTIADYDKKRKRYTLCFPNEEVEYGFLENLIPEYTPAAASGTGTDIFTLETYIEDGNLEGIRNVLTALFASIPYTEDRNPFEHYFQSVIYLIFTLLGKYARCEMHTFTGRIDCILEAEDYIYIFEFKRDDTVEAALAQIEEMEYALPFVADQRKLYKIGVTFDSERRMLSDWKVEE